jgi:hypothetical protein
MKRFGMIVALLFVTVVCTAVGVSAAQTGPALTVEEPRIDLGDVKAGSVAEATYTFHNTGSTDVKILSAKPT